MLVKTAALTLLSFVAGSALVSASAQTPLTCESNGVSFSFLNGETKVVVPCQEGFVCRQTTEDDIDCVPSTDAVENLPAEDFALQAKSTKSKKAKSAKTKKIKSTKTKSTKTKSTKTTSAVSTKTTPSSSATTTTAKSTKTTTTTVTTTTATTTAGPAPSGTPSFVPRNAPKPVGVVGYWPNWAMYSRPQNGPTVVDLTGVNVINYAFFNVLDNGDIASFDAWADFGTGGQQMDIDPYTGKNKGIYNLNFIAREKNPNLRTVVSFGGWSGSVHFSNVAKSSSARANFVSKAIAFVNKFHFDGIDIDWEYPGGGGLPCNTVDPNDAINFETLLGDLRSALGPNRILSIASAGASFRYNVGSKNYVSSYMKHLSYLQIMSYDFYGSWVPYTDFNAPLNEDPSQPKANLQNNQVFSIANAFKDFVGQGVSPSQLVVGLAFYGRSWIASAKGSNNGLYQLCGNLANGQKQDPSKPKACPAPPGDQLDADWTDPCGATYKSGVWMYLNLRKQGVLSGPTTAGSGYTRQYHDFAQSPSLYETSTGRFISYDDPQSLQAKAAWAKAQGAGGVMFWELSEDYQRELLNAVQAGWGH